MTTDRDFLLILAEAVWRLQEWIEEHEMLSTVPIAHMVVSCSGSQIRVGDAVVACSEEDPELFDDPVNADAIFGHCRETFMRWCGELIVFCVEPE